MSASMNSVTLRRGALAITMPDTAPYWALRFGAAGCFIGHGVFGLITKAAWLPYFAVVGIPEPWAWKLMPLVGAVDVLAGMAVLFAPTRLPLVYMAIWAVWTALLRPLAGESVFEAVERAGNYGVPLAMLLWLGVPTSWRALVGYSTSKSESIAPRQAVRSVLQVTTSMLLAGHGALALLGKPLLANHAALIGLSSPAAMYAGWFEIVLAVVIALRPSVALLVFVVAWKVGSESLYVAAGAPVWEFVERAGSYAVPAALAALLVLNRRRNDVIPQE